MKNTKQPNRSIMNSAEQRITMKIKKTLTSLPRLDLLAVQPLQGQKSTIENGRLRSLMFERQQKMTNIFLLLLVIDMLLLYLFYQGQTFEAAGHLWMPLSFAIHCFNTAIFGVVLMLQFQENSIIHKQNISSFYQIMRVIGFLVVHPAPWWKDFKVELTYHDRGFENGTFLAPMNHMVLIMTILKNMYFVFTRYLINTHYLQPRGKRLKSIFSVDISQELYAVKCIFKESPIRMFIVFYLSGFFFFGFAFQITESQAPVESNPFRFFQNSVWFTFITVTTVGYGDIRTFTHIGYILNICCMVWGTLIMSCILVILTNTLTLNPKQEEALCVLKKIEINIEYRYLCRLYVREALWRLWNNYKHRGNKREPVSQRKMRQKLFKLRQSRKLMNPSTNIAELSQRQFDICINHADLLRANNTNMINFIGSHIFSEVLIREKDQNYQSFIDRRKEKVLEDGLSNSQDNLNSESYSQQESKQSIVQSLSSLSSHSDQLAIFPQDRLSAARPNKSTCIKVQDLKSDSSIKSEQLIKEDGI